MTDSLRDSLRVPLKKRGIQGPYLVAKTSANFLDPSLSDSISGGTEIKIILFKKKTKNLKLSGWYLQTLSTCDYLRFYTILDGTSHVILVDLLSKNKFIWSKRKIRKTWTFKTNAIPKHFCLYIHFQPNFKMVFFLWWVLSNTKICIFRFFYYNQPLVQVL